MDVSFQFSRCDFYHVSNVTFIIYHCGMSTVQNIRARLHEKNNFAGIFKNLARYRLKNNFVEL